MVLMGAKKFYVNKFSNCFNANENLIYNKSKTGQTFKTYKIQNNANLVKLKSKSRGDGLYRR